MRSVYYLETTAPRLNQCVAGSLPSQRQSPGLSHLNGFESVVYSPPKEKDHPMGGLFLLVETTGLEPVTSCV